MDDISKIRRYLDKEKKRIIARKAKVILIEESASLHGSLLTINKILNYLDNLEKGRL